MRVNVVCRNPTSDRVLPRFARYLSRYNGWNLSRGANPEYDLNYYLAYFEQQLNKNFVGTVAAYFTHYEPGAKGDLYDQVAEMVQLRVAMNEGQLEHLKSFGPTIVPPLPVELDRFTLRSGAGSGARAGRGLPIIGFSGYTYNSGRKGEDLAKKLVSKFESQASFRASGRGWPCPTVGYPWELMPEFFKSLDLFVCPSSIEGGPMTTLESLATGVPVVVPRGVGIHPQLPRIRGIYRYEAGNYRSLEVAVSQALEELGSIDRQALRGAVLANSVEAFCESTRLAFERQSPN